MKLFTPDLFRNFGIGFAVSAAIILAGPGGGLLAAVPQFFAKLF